MIYIGQAVNTHGVKGEIRILSDFKYKDLVFQKGNHLFIDDSELVIKSHRIHKNYDMVTFEGIDDIDAVLKYKGKVVYIDRSEYVFPDVLNEDLIGFKVYGDDKFIGILSAIKKNVNQELLVVKSDKKEYLIPYVPAFIKNIGDEKIEINVIKGLINED